MSPSFEYNNTNTRRVGAALLEFKRGIGNERKEEIRDVETVDLCNNANNLHTLE